MFYIIYYNNNFYIINLKQLQWINCDSSKEIWTVFQNHLVYGTSAIILYPKYLNLFKEVSDISRFINIHSVMLDTCLELMSSG